MKLVIINTWIHPKNLNALLAYSDFEIIIVNSIEEFEKMDTSNIKYVYSPAHPIDVTKYKSIRFIFGPHFSIFPDSQINSIIGSNSVYVQPCKWCVDVWKSFSICDNLNITSMPFGVDTEEFCEVISSECRDKVFIYYKDRRPDELALVESFLKNKNVSYRVFNYMHKYNAHEYLEWLQQSKYGIWIGRHESQGFALEEALSCNVPLFVWNVSSINQAYGYNFNDLPATAIPYWDERCGEVFYNYADMQKTYALFLSKLDSYSPRQYIVDNLTNDICSKKMLSIFENI